MVAVNGEDALAGLVACGGGHFQGKVGHPAPGRRPSDLAPLPLPPRISPPILSSSPVSSANTTIWPDCCIRTWNLNC